MAFRVLTYLIVHDRIHKNGDAVFGQNLKQNVLTETQYNDRSSTSYLIITVMVIMILLKSRKIMIIIVIVIKNFALPLVGESHR